LRVSQYGLAQIVQDPECSKQAPISDRLLHYYLVFNHPESSWRNGYRPIIKTGWEGRL